MNNLASHDESEQKIAETDTQIIKELTAAGITCEVQPQKVQGEVSTRIIGKANGFTFDRRWYYWAVDGRVPLAVAQELYSTEVGKKAVRVAGHCGCPPPEEWATTFDKATGKMVTSDEEWNKGLKLFSGERWENALKDWTTNHIPESQAGETEKFVLTYHIDTQEGLNFFVVTLRKYNLI